MTDRRVAELEQLAFAAWPALESETRHGWVLRAAQGFTKRANSANALTPDDDFHATRQSVESFYAGRGLPTIFRLTPLAPLVADEALDVAGYVASDPSRVMIADLRADAAEPSARIDPAVSESWLAGFADANAVAVASRPIHDAILSRIMSPAAFLSLRHEDQIIGYGMAVRAAEWIGLFDLVILPEFRGQGWGRRLLSSLMAWGYAQGARYAYLQVRDGNDVARQLYASAGFADLYRYHYRVKI